MTVSLWEGGLNHENTKSVHTRSYGSNEPEYRAAVAGRAPDGVFEPVAVLGAGAAETLGAARLLWLEQWAARKKHGGKRLTAKALAAARRRPRRRRRRASRTAAGGGTARRTGRTGG